MQLKMSRESAAIKIRVLDEKHVLNICVINEKTILILLANKYYLGVYIWHENELVAMPSTGMVQ